MKNRTSSNISANMMNYTFDNASNEYTEKQGLLPSQVSSSSTTSSSDVVVSYQSPLRQQQSMDRPIGEGGIDNDNSIKDISSTGPLQSAVLFLNPILPFLVLSISIFYIGWYGPRYMMDQYIDVIIERNTPPYQIISLGNTKKERIVILDPTYNHPFVDPPTISSSLLIMASVTIPLIVLCIWPFASLIINLTCMNLTSSSTTSLQRPKKFLRIKSSSCDNLIINNTTPKYVTRFFVFAFYESVLIVSGLLLSIGITEGITQCIKMFIGRLRPNMYQLCEFDINTLQYSSTVLKTQIREGHLSFPSGHSSLASVSMIYCTWYALYYYSPIIGRTMNYTMKPFNQYNGIRCNRCILLSLFRTLLIVLLLPGFAVYVGMTRIIDHWHHISDVLAGLVLGFSIGTIVFHIVVHPIFQYVTGIVANDSNETRISSTILSIQPPNIPSASTINIHAADRV